MSVASHDEMVEPANGLFWRTRHPSSWSLRVRLVAVQAVLLALVCAGIGAGVLLALNRFLMDQLDDQVVDAGWRSSMLYTLGPPPQAPNEQRPSGPGPFFLNAPGQASGTVGGVYQDGRVRDAAVITGRGNLRALTAGAREQLGMLAAQPESRILDGLGRYRVITTPGRGGEAVITGLPTKSVDDTLFAVVGILTVIGVVALTAAITAGVLILRRQLAPLSAVASTAQRIADSELDHGEVTLPRAQSSTSAGSRHTEVGRLSSAFDRMLHRIGEAMAARHASETRVRQFVADASHELRTPLAAIRGYTELVQRQYDSSPDQLAHAMSRIDSEAKRMSRLVEDLLLLARLDAGRPLEHVPVDLSALAVDAVSDAHAAGRGHRWDLELPDEPVVVTGDAGRLHQVLANLLSNARVHTPEGSTVTTVLARESDAVTIKVVDDGPGIPEEQRSEIFGRFVRGDSSRSRRGGSTGLGLAIVSAVVQAHGGSITVESVPSATSFTVTLPFRGDEPPHDQAAETCSR
ncbi:sensor histidine kinase [Mycobacterium sp. BMJ-28]